MIFQHVKTSPATRLYIKPLDEATVTRRSMLCAVCPWNVDWICQHVGCLPCQQRRDGGLHGKIARPHETCPAGKW